MLLDPEEGLLACPQGAPVRAEPPSVTNRPMSTKQMAKGNSMLIFFAATASAAAAAPQPPMRRISHSNRVSRRCVSYTRENPRRIESTFSVSPGPALAHAHALSDQLPPLPLSHDHVCAERRQPLIAGCSADSDSNQTAWKSRYYGRHCTVDLGVLIDTYSDV